MKESVDDTEVRFVTCKTHLLPMAEADIPEPIVPAGLSRERQVYLYRHVRPLVRQPYQDILCPTPESSD